MLLIAKKQKQTATKKGQSRGPVSKPTIPLTSPFCPLQAVLSMLQDMNFINNYKIDCPTLARCVSPPLSAQAAPSLTPSVLGSHIHPPACWGGLCLGQLGDTQSCGGGEDP